ncbi:hypothetical protein [Candidatus Nephthysia bennettiae]|uniref:P27 family phage terminase small subunit n=1 Tax=Candidatus Nephthysia bennettiae TaxID=3127016 RepID=A0A934JVG2_9BACT|nr:P27 family phage terminase small subunit [Candidatus Dormibacteraeota bacterium]
MGGKGSGGHNRLSADEHRRRGTYRAARHRQQPPELVLLPAQDSPVEPHRPLGRAGRTLWDAAAQVPWLSPADRELLLIACEMVDERVMLRVQVFQDGERLARSALRQLDAELLSTLSLLGLTPTARAGLGVDLADLAGRVSKLDALRRPDPSPLEPS